MEISTRNHHKANDLIAEGMATALGMWFVPGATVACNMAEAAMVSKILKTTGSEWGEGESNEIYWFFRKHYMALNAATFIPWVGAALQALEVFAMGQFALACVEKDVQVSDGEALEIAWLEIQPVVWSGERAVNFYEEYSGKKFPPNAKAQFIKMVDAASRGAHQVTTEFPIVSRIQGAAGDILRDGLGGAARHLKKFFQ
jgi:hypothetical protein